MFGAGARGIGELPFALHQSFQVVHRPCNNTVFLQQEFFLEVAVLFILRYGVIEAYQNQPPVEAVAAVAVILGDIVAGKQEPRKRLERKILLKLVLCRDIVLTGDRLERTRVADITGGQVSENVRQLTEKLNRCEFFVQLLLRQV